MSGMVTWLDRVCDRMDAKTFRIRRGTAIQALYSRSRIEQTEKRIASLETWTNSWRETVRDLYDDLHFGRDNLFTGNGLAKRIISMIEHRHPAYFKVKLPRTTAAELLPDLAMTELYSAATDEIERLRGWIKDIGEQADDTQGEGWVHAQVRLALAGNSRPFPENEREMP